MRLPLLIWLSLTWIVCLILEVILTGAADSERISLIRQLASSGSFTTTFDQFGLSIPLPNTQFAGALVQMLAWDFSFFANEPYIYIRFLFMAISGGVALSFLSTFGPAILGGFRGLLSFLPWP